MNKHIALTHKDYYLIFFITFLSFLISANIAWLNPFPDGVLYKTFDRIPFLWQYDRDAPVELLSAAEFPTYFDRDPSRLERPGYPLLVAIVANFLYFFGGYYIDIPYIYYAGGAYQIVKFIFYYLGGVTLFWILLNFFKRNYALLGVIIYFLHWTSIIYFTEIHTTDMHILNPIFFTFFFLNLSSNFNYRKLVVFSILGGYLILIKSLYASFIAIIIFLILKRKFFQTTIFFIIHFIPILIWIFFLNYKNIPLYFHVEAGHNNYVTWFFQALSNGDFMQIFLSFLMQLKIFFLMFFIYFHIYLIPIILGIIKFLMDKTITYKKNFLIFSILIIFLSFIQMFLAQKLIKDIYIFGDSFIVFIFFITYFFEKIEFLKRVQLKFTNYFFIIAIISVIKIINFPYQSPFDQKSIDWKNKFKTNSKSLHLFR